MEKLISLARAPQGTKQSQGKVKRRKPLGVLAQGAEAKIFLDNKRNTIIKRRIKKSYRLPLLDERIRTRRTRSETKLLKKASEIIPIPGNIKGDEKTKEIVMDFIDGSKLSESLDEFPLKNQKKLLQEIGKAIAKLHDAGLIHGDLTTSNMIYKNGEIFFIDFGLGFHSQKIEDKAVDIHVLKQALEAKHFQNWETLFKEFEKAYNNQDVLERLKEVEKRGRYKH